MSGRFEKSIEQSAARIARERYAVESIHLVASGSTGWPDREFWIHGGRPLLIEFKRPGEEPTKKQLHIHAKLRSYGYEVEVHDTVAGAVEAVKAAVGRAWVEVNRKSGTITVHLGGTAQAVDSAQGSAKGGEMARRARVRRSLPRPGRR